MINYRFLYTEAVDEFAKDLFGAFAVVSMTFFAEEGAKFGFGDHEISFLEYGQYVGFLQVQRDAQFLENFVVRQEIRRFGNGA